ncbi:hypothetical protein ACQKPE_07405 [Pseudomonas sp. NPDC089554]|uniref:hypothetical protein n=1 Tax=Pseudomonas sp. NPDC089554 TaxID=3390653 RepID=UPI003D06DE06
MARLQARSYKGAGEPGGAGLPANRGHASPQPAEIHDLIRKFDHFSIKPLQPTQIKGYSSNPTSYPQVRQQRLWATSQHCLPIEMKKPRKIRGLG